MSNRLVGAAHVSKSWEASFTIPTSSTTPLAACCDERPSLRGRCSRRCSAIRVYRTSIFRSTVRACPLHRLERCHLALLPPSGGCLHAAETIRDDSDSAPAHLLLPSPPLPSAAGRDKPGNGIRGLRAPPLAFSYTTARGTSDIPLPDYTYWGLPYADLPPWPEWLRFASRPENSWERKLDQMVWVGSPTNPMRQAFQRCARSHFGGRLVHRMPQKDPMHELAWRCKPSADGVPCATKPADWTPLQEQCRFRYILHLPGISDWLEHFKHQLACGSVNIFIGTRPSKAWLARAATALARQQSRQRSSTPLSSSDLGPPSTFEHFDFSGPLLVEGEHYIYVPVGGGNGGVCRALSAALEALERSPARAKCIASEGARLSRELSMERVYGYMAQVLTEASARQAEGVARSVVRAEASRLVTRQNYFSFIPPAKRPWMEHIFVPWYRQRFNETPMLPPHGAETASGLFH